MRLLQDSTTSHISSSLLTNGHCKTVSHSKFLVNKHSFQDRLNLLMATFKAKNMDEKRASGISPELQEIDTLLEELCEKEEAKK